jgi:hypothetical protein
MEQHGAAGSSGEQHGAAKPTSEHGARSQAQWIGAFVAPA